MVKNPNWQEADQLAIYKRVRGVELWAPRNNSSWRPERDLNPGPPDFKSGPGALATRPCCLHDVGDFEREIFIQVAVHE